MASDSMMAILTKVKVGKEFNLESARHKDNEEKEICKFTIPEGELVVKVREKELKDRLEPVISSENGEQPRKQQNLDFYRPYSHNDIFFSCPPSELFQLTKDELGLLLAVKTPSLRIQEYLTPNKLKETLLLVVGSVVMFSLRVEPHLSSVKVRGVIQYIGSLHNEEGTFFGIEIQEDNYCGKGFTNGKPHFTCDDNNGVFVAMDKIVKKLDKEQQCQSSERSESGSDDKSQQVSLFKSGDRVVLQSVKGDVIYGTVRWTGQVGEKGSLIKTIGIETDRKIRPDKDFPELHITVTGTNGGKPFRVGFGHSRVFLPEQLVVHENEFIELQKREKALEQEAKIAKEFDLSLEEYRSQRDYIERANSDRDTCQRDVLNTEHSIETDGVSNKENENVDLANGSDKSNYNGEPFSSKQIKKVKHEFESQVEAKNHEDIHASRCHALQKEETVIVDDFVNISLSPDLIESSTNHIFVGSLVTVPVQRRGQPLHGVVMWIGTLPDFPGTIAGIQLEEPLVGCTDGTWQGMRFFDCPQGKGFFCPLNTVKHVPMEVKQKMRNPLADKAPLLEEHAAMLCGTNQLYIGTECGIQGHHDSSYVDATIFSLFALSHSFDDILSIDELPQDEVKKKIIYYLRNGIINPLRKYGLARYESVADLCNCLDQLRIQINKSTEEKDPEELLNLLFKEVFHVNEFMSINYPFGVEKEFFVQLFYEIDTERSEFLHIEMLLLEMFKEQQISFTEVPTRLLIQVPRCGKNIKNKAVPSLSLNIKPLLDTNAVLLSPLSNLILQSVICIDTSHYVCYTRSGDQWLFHDSMDNKLYDMYNVPKVVDVSKELQEWVYSGKNLAAIPTKNIPEYVRRFTQDIYMCIYVQADVKNSLFILDDDIPQSSFKQDVSYSLTNNDISQSDELYKLRKEAYIRGNSHFDEIVAPIQKLHANNIWLSSKLDHLSNNYEKLIIVLEEERNKNVALTRIQYKKDQDHSHLQESHKLLEKKVEQVQCQLELVREKNIALEKQLSSKEESWKVSHEDIALSKQELGRGGWGVIWIGEFRGQKVAVKQMHDLITHSQGNLELLHREINIMAQLRHPNLLQFIGAVFDHPSGNPMIITEVMDTSLRKAYEEKLLTPDQQPVILSIMRNVAVGLNYLHCLPDPIIHRDVSSANVLLESKGPGQWKTKISDFGSAKIARSAMTAGPGAIVYTAPECLRSLISTLNKKQDQSPQFKQSPKMDCFSFGILFCEVITCQFPNMESFTILLDQVQRNTSQALYELVTSCIREDPKDRPLMIEVIQQIDI